jgi:D-alanyl-lipoteichoic acid acyltransferase DltB (MBOAT superfamily)
MGFRLMENFENPYQSKSISEFWKRWHISLSSWFRDYLYISLGGNRVSIPRWYFNLFIVFLVSGFWHGANWTFIMWGALHGFYLVFAIILKRPNEYITSKLGLKKFPLLYQALQVSTTFVLVTFAWIFFRARSVSDAFYIIKKISSKHWGGLQDMEVFSPFSMVLSVGLIFFLFIAERKIKPVIECGLNERYKTSLAFGISILSMILLLGVFQKLSFIYFQF